MVLRGTTDITTIANNDLLFYSYFSPNDANVSQIHYYMSANGKQLLADVTPMTANPPSGTLITAQKQTFVIVTSWFQLPGVNLFNYLDASGSIMPLPISDLHTIKGIQVNLASPTKAPSGTGNDAITIQVMLRNRKTNL